MSTNSLNAKKPYSDTLTSLVGPFSISITNIKRKDEYEASLFAEKWTFFRIDNNDSKSDEKRGVGSLALASLEKAAKYANSDEIMNKIAYQLICRTEYSKETNILSVNMHRSDTMSKNIREIDDDFHLLKTVSTVILQRAIFKHYQYNRGSSLKIMIHPTPHTKSLSLSPGLILALENLNKEKTPLNKIQQKICTQLFGIEDEDSVELVDMVDSDGEPIAILPRKIVHTYNVLHRGIGMIVCQNKHIGPAMLSSSHNNIPMVYCHRRTDTKRIFPSLYDMFIGGVSVTGENSTLTAAREVAEELGLNRALLLIEEKTNAGLEYDINEEDILRGPLFKCTVCTGYNRCVVTMFTYCIDDEKEKLKWQEEEVAWGDYVPYDIVEKAGNLSINRLKEKGTWPGEYGEIANIEVEDPEAEWATWDFVPDGLLVWEAWEKWCKYVC